MPSVLAASVTETPKFSLRRSRRTNFHLFVVNSPQWHVWLLDGFHGRPFIPDFYESDTQQRDHAHRHFSIAMLLKWNQHKRSRHYPIEHNSPALWRLLYRSPCGSSLHLFRRIFYDNSFLYNAFTAQWLISLFSRPGSMTKPMRACENKKQSPQDKHACPYTHTCNRTCTFHLRDSHKKSTFSVGFFLSALSVLGIGLNRREKKWKRGRDGFCSHPPHIGVKSWTKGENSGKRPSDGLKIGGKRNGQNCFFFSPSPENQWARRTRNREINHRAL